MEGPLYVLELPTNHDPEMVFHACELWIRLQDEARTKLCDACNEFNAAVTLANATPDDESCTVTDAAVVEAVVQATEYYKRLRKEREEEEERMVQGCIMAIDLAKEFPHIAMYATIAHVHYRMMTNESRARTRFLYFNR
jgi:hypothetical protein